MCGESICIVTERLAYDDCHWLSPHEDEKKTSGWGRVKMVYIYKN